MIPQLLLITRAESETTENLLATLRPALAGGVDTLLLRKKTLDSAKLLALAATLRSVSREYGARLLIHSQADVCRAVEADGVHLAAHDMHELSAIRRYVGAKASLSVSCHNTAQLQQAAKFNADFAFLSPLFTTASHPNSPSLGVQRWREIAEDSPIPVIALGGINGENRQHVATFPVAVIRSIWEAKDPYLAAQQLRGQCNKGVS